MSSHFLLNINTNFNTKKKFNQKWKIPHMLSERLTLRFSSCKNRELKVFIFPEIIFLAFVFFS